jgi:hypothetical protein
VKRRCVAQDLENGKRPPQQRLEAGLRFDHDELSRSATAATSGASSAITL